MGRDGTRDVRDASTREEGAARRDMMMMMIYISHKNKKANPFRVDVLEDRDTTSSSDAWGASITSTRPFLQKYGAMPAAPKVALMLRVLWWWGRQTEEEEQQEERHDDDGGGDDAILGSIGLALKCCERARRDWSKKKKSSATTPPPPAATPQHHKYRLAASCVSEMIELLSLQLRQRRYKTTRGGCRQAVPNAHAMQLLRACTCPTWAHLLDNNHHDNDEEEGWWIDPMM